MDSHPVDPIALISGLFFALAGISIFADQQWDDVDVTAFTAAGVTLLGLLLAGLAVVQLIAARSNEPDVVNTVDANVDLDLGDEVHGDGDDLTATDDVTSPLPVMPSETDPDEI